MPFTLFVGRVKRFRISFYFLCFVLLYSSAAPAKDASNVAIQQARRYLQSYHQISGVPGLAVVVGQNGKIIWQENFGLSDLETRVAVTPDTRFRLGSVSKVLTTGALARLVDRGELDLDSPIQKYLPSIPSSLSTITTRQLAGHLAGIRHYTPKDYIEPECRNFKTVTESLARFINDPVINAPGEKYSYSTVGYVLLSAVIESAAKRDFLKVL